MIVARSRPRRIPALRGVCATALSPLQGHRLAQRLAAPTWIAGIAAGFGQPPPAAPVLPRLLHLRVSDSELRLGCLGRQPAAGQPLHAGRIERQAPLLAEPSPQALPGQDKTNLGRGQYQRDHEQHRHNDTDGDQRRSAAAKESQRDPAHRYRDEPGNGDDE